MMRGSDAGSKLKYVTEETSVDLWWGPASSMARTSFMLENNSHSQLEADSVPLI